MNFGIERAVGFDAIKNANRIFRLNFEVVLIIRKTVSGIVVSKFISLRVIWLIILIVIVAALVFRVVACMQKSKEPGETWNLRDKYAANDFGE